MFNDQEIQESQEIAHINRDLFRGMRSQKYPKPRSRIAEFFVEWVLPIGGGALFGFVLALMLFFSL